MSFNNAIGSSGLRGETTRPAEMQEESADVPSLKGWAAIQDYMRRHDEGMVKDFANDVDTLLVFVSAVSIKVIKSCILMEDVEAGLFSSVLTTFLSQTYQTLQPDNSQLTVQLLSQISTQLGSLTISQPFVNSTIPPSPSASSEVSQSLSAVTINSLWFLSLVFSLAAALFGIHVKQWLREYIKWNAPLSSESACENVLIRQARLEAWERWQVSAIIAAIPALLEIAVVLFYSGMAVFLWTLDRTVPIIVTIAIAILLAITVLLTIIPVFFRRCPYKSPTGWVFVYILQCFRRFFDKPSLRIGPPVHSIELTLQWRQRDLQAIVTHHQSLRAGEINLLYNAFLWFLCTPGSDGLSHDILQCLQSLYEDVIVDDVKQDTWERASARYISVMSMIQHFRVVLEDTKLPYREVGGPDARTRTIGSYVLTGICVPGQRNVTSAEANRIHPPLPGATVVITRTAREVTSARTDRSDRATNIHANSQWIIHRLALCELRLQAEIWFQQLGSSDLEHLKTSTARVAEMIVLLYPFRRDTSQAIRGALDPTFTVELGKVLLDIYHKVSHLSDAHRTGITAMILEILCLSGGVSFDSHNHNLLRAQPVAYNSDIDPDLALWRSITTTKHFSKGNGSAHRHMFILLANFSLRAISWTGKIGQSMVNELLLLMETVAKESILARKKNCGGFVDLPWIDQLKEILEKDTKQQGVHIFTDQITNESLIRLLSTLKRSLEAKLITGRTAAEDLKECFRLLRVHEDDLSSLPPDLWSRLDAAGHAYHRRQGENTVTTTYPPRQHRVPTVTVPQQYHVPSIITIPQPYRVPITAVPQPYHVSAAPRSYKVFPGLRQFNCLYSTDDVFHSSCNIHGLGKSIQSTGHGNQNQDINDTRTDLA